jgi:phosphonate transport system substrate-binding protein
MSLYAWIAGLALAAAPAATPPAATSPAVVPPKPIPPKPAPPLTVGVASTLGPKVAKADADKIGAYLKKELKREVSPVVFKTYEELAIALVDDKVDFAWMPPLQGFNAKLGGATIVAKLLRNGSPHYRAVLFARGDAKYTDLASLQGARVAWVDRNSSAGYLFPLATLAKAKLTPGKLFSDQKFLGNHQAVCKAVESKKADVGATFADEPPAGKDPHALEVTGCKQATGAKAAGLKVVAVSEPVPNDVLVVRKSLDAPTRTAITQAILGMPQNKDGKALLKQAFTAEGVAEVQEGDFDPVQRALEAASEVEVAK